MKIEISSISSETIFESLETISGPISWFECSIRVLGTQLARFHSYFQNPSRKFMTSSRLCPLKYPLDHMVAQVSQGENKSKNGSRGENNDQFWAHCARKVPCVYTEPFSGPQSQKMSEKSFFPDFFCPVKFSKKSWCHLPGVVTKDTPVTVPRPRNYFSQMIYAIKTPNLKDWCVRRNLRRMKTFCRHIHGHIHETDQRLYTKNSKIKLTIGSSVGP